MLFGWLALALVIAVAIRVAYLYDYRSSPLYDVAIGPDVQAYWEAARRVLAGHWLWQADATHGPLYPLVLAAWSAISRESLVGVRAIQLLMGVLGCGILTLVVGRRCGLAVAVCTALLWAACVPLVYYEAELFSEGTGLFLNACVVAVLIGGRRVRPIRAAVAGLLLGLSAVTHAMALLFAGLIVIWLAWSAGRASLRRGVQITGLAVLGVALPVVPVVWYNSHVAGEFVLLQETAGLNYYIGNNPAADGTPNVRIGPDWDRLLALPCVEAGLPEAAGHSGFYYNRALTFMRQSPGRWLLLLAKKAALSVNAHEITASTPMSAIRGDVWLLRWRLIGFGVLLPLALVGLSVAGGWRVKPAWILVLAYVVGQTIYVAAGRYRVPMLPGVFVLAGLGLAHLIACVRSGAWGRLWPAAVPLVLGVVVAWLPVVPKHNDDPVEGALARALAYRAQGNWTAGAGELWQALKQRPDYAPALLTLGEMYQELGRRDAAIEEYQAAVAAHPEYGAAQLCLAEALLKRDGDLEAARPHYLRAVESNPEDCKARFLFGRALLVWDEWASAAEHFRFILSRRPDDVDAARGLGEALADLGQYAEAVTYLEQAAAAMPTNVRLWTRLTRLRAACPDDAVRDVRAALECGRRAASLTGGTDPQALDALAMALANAGEFEQAIEAAEAAADLARRQGRGDLRAEILSRRELYEKQTPYRDAQPR